MDYNLLSWFNSKYKKFKLIDEQNEDITTEEILKDIEKNYFEDKESDSYKIYGDDVISYFKENILQDKNSSISIIKKSTKEEERI